MKWRALISSFHMRQALLKYESLLKQSDVQIILPKKSSQYLIESEMLDLVDDSIDGIICSDDHITRKVMEKAKNLKIISKWGVGIDSIDRKAAEDRGIRIFNSPGAFSRAVTEMTLCYILCFARQPLRVTQSMQRGEWIKFGGRSLSSMTLGIVGVGSIGKMLARQASFLGMPLLGNDIKKVDSGFIRETKIQMVSLKDLLRDADVVSLNCDYNSSSHHLIGQRELAMMKPDAVLINTARGPVVDQEALVETLKKGMIAGAALDVFESEPLPEDDELRRLGNVLLAPHNSYNTLDAVDFVHQNTIMNLLNFFKQCA